MLASFLFLLTTPFFIISPILLAASLALQGGLAWRRPGQSGKARIVSSYLALSVIVLASCSAFFIMISEVVKNDDGTMFILEEYRTADMDAIASSFDVLDLLFRISPHLVETSTDVGLVPGEGREGAGLWNGPALLMNPMRYAFLTVDRARLDLVAEVLESRGIRRMDKRALTPVSSMIRSEVLFSARVSDEMSLTSFSITCIGHHDDTFSALSMGRIGAIDMTAAGRGMEASSFCRRLAARDFP